MRGALPNMLRPLEPRRPPVRGADVVAMYDRSAGTWDAGLRRLGYHRAYVSLLHRLRDAGEFQGLAHGGHTLDCGIGTAALSIALARTMPMPLRLTGVDIAAGMLREARERLLRVGMPASLYRADVACLPFRSDTFDLVISGHMLEYAADPPQVIAEMVRVLRPNASLLAVVTHRGLLDWLIRRRWHYTLLDAERITTWFASAGLGQLRWYPVGEPGSLAARLGVACVGVKRAP